VIGVERQHLARCGLPSRSPLAHGAGQRLRAGCPDRA
jgi:hypothetical protein